MQKNVASTGIAVIQLGHMQRVLFVCRLSCIVIVLGWLCCGSWHTWTLCCVFRSVQAARDVANTIAHSSNRVFLNADSLLLNLGDLNTRGDMK